MNRDSLFALRLLTVDNVERELKSGVAKQIAYASAALAGDVHPRTVRAWWSLVESAPKEEWSKLLCPQPCKPKRIIDERAWRSFLVLYLDFTKPTIVKCYEQTQKVCEVFGWHPLPSLSVVQRRLLDVPTHVVKLARDGILGLRSSAPLLDDRDNLRRDAERYLADLRGQRGAA